MFPSLTGLSGQCRAFLALGRVSNLPTVWSNCLAGWLLGGGGPWDLFLVVCASTTLLYVGGMFLNDACDADFDRQFRPERPIPSGVISEYSVLGIGSLLLCTGLMSLLVVGGTPFKIGVALAGCIALYNITHKTCAYAPVLMGLCRVLLVLVASTATRGKIEGLALWSALVLGAYVIGLSYLAREESHAVQAKYWPSVLLFLPIALCLLVNDGEFCRLGLVLAGVLFAWLTGCLVTAYGNPPQHIGRAVAKLLAGMILVDLAAVGPANPDMVILFPVLFICTLASQKFVAAT